MSELGELIGQVTEDEKTKILILYGRKVGIDELSATLDSDLLTSSEKEHMEKKIALELKITQDNMQEWWKEMQAKYQWKRIDGHQWHINFENGEIFLD